MATGVTSWSKTAASNATADSNVNWAEGQAPSSVNNSSRAEMASVAMWRDDINASITTGGTSTAYTVTSNQTFAALSAGIMVAFTPHTTNGATVTLNVDGLGAKPLRTAPGSTYELTAGMLAAGTPYTATYYTSNSGEWILHSFFVNPYNVPLGGGMMWFTTTAPNSNFVFPYGQAISRTTYASLFSLFSTTYGTGDGSTTFNVPDLRGRYPLFKDDMGGSAAGNVTSIAATTLGTTGGAQSTTIAQANLPAVTLTTTITDPGHTHRPRANNSSAGTSAPSGNFFGNAGLSNYSTGVDAFMATTESSTTGITASTALGGSGTAISRLPPTLVISVVIRVL